MPQEATNVNQGTSSPASPLTDHHGAVLSAPAVVLCFLFLQSKKDY